ncbi:MAG TPA: SDR family NAD(P)-dependent oxidoreductase [Arsenicitalea sp.]|nr:SDR family NAD(P)-dependent oxidoreductase [Arsenicitalea sp.]
MDVTGKKAIVTGGASGIGVETARALANAGAAVTLAVRRPEAAEAVAAELRQSTGNAAIDLRRLIYPICVPQPPSPKRGKVRCISW